MGRLLRFKEHLSLEDAAFHIAETIRESVSVADLLQMAIDGHVQLSINLVNSVHALKAPDVGFCDSEFVMPRGAVIPIDGLCDLTLMGDAKKILQHHLHWITDRPAVDLIGSDGLFVTQGAEIYQLQQAHFRGADEVYYMPLCELPRRADLVIRSEEVKRFIADIIGGPKEEAKSELMPKERNTLLTIIAALCTELDIDYTGRGKAVAIQKMLEKIGISMSLPTIRSVLVKVQEAVERRQN